MDFWAAEYGDATNNYETEGQYRPYIQEYF